MENREREIRKKWDAKPNAAEREDCSLSVPSSQGKNTVCITCARNTSSSHAQPAPNLQPTDEKKNEASSHTSLSHHTPYPAACKIEKEEKMMRFIPTFPRKERKNPTRSVSGTKSIS